MKYLLLHGFSVIGCIGEHFVLEWGKHMETEEEYDEDALYDEQREANYGW